MLRKRWQISIPRYNFHLMKTEWSSREASSPDFGAELSFPVIGVFFTGCDIAPMEDDEADAKPEFPNRIRKARKAKRLNLVETAEAADMSFPTLQRWETKQPWMPLSKVEKLAEVLGVTPHDLLPYHPKPIDAETAFILERMRTADPATRRAILRSVKGLTDRDADDFEIRPPAKKR
jgi:transcriptional regulator with XRE-family HTH domain